MFSNWVPRNPSVSQAWVRSSETLKYVLMNQFYWLSQICMYELQFVCRNSALIITSPTARWQSVAASVQKLPDSVAKSTSGSPQTVDISGETIRLRLAVGLLHVLYIECTQVLVFNSMLTLVWASRGFSTISLGFFNVPIAKLCTEAYVCCDPAWHSLIRVYARCYKCQDTWFCSQLVPSVLFLVQLMSSVLFLVQLVPAVLFLVQVVPAVYQNLCWYSLILPYHLYGGFFHADKSADGWSSPQILSLPEFHNNVLYPSVIHLPSQTVHATLKLVYFTIISPSPLFAASVVLLMIRCSTFSPIHFPKHGHFAF
jgi:hypothetical protein